MKRQRNTQQVKEQEKCPPNQTKEEEIGNLPEKEFQILIVKLIQNLGIKMETQINSLETRIEKMQERFNKDLEEIKKSQYIMKNAINEIKNTLDRTNRITEAEDRIQFSSVLHFSRSVVSDSLRPHESQHARLPCPSLTPGVHPNSCPSSQ